MNTIKKIAVVLAILPLLLSTLSVANETFDTKLLALQNQWAVVNYTLTEDKQNAGFLSLIEQANILVEQPNNKAQSLIWLGIIQSSYAGAKGGLGALTLVKKAKKSFEQSLKIDQQALQGSAYTSLGTLYHQVPGWPIGFGNDDKAREMLKKAVAINPKGIDPNYFYGTYLFDKKEYEAAKTFLHMALNAPNRATRPLADKHRRIEITQILDMVNVKLGQ